MEHYFNKLIALAIAEDHYKNFIKKEIRIERIIKYSIESYGIRSLDIDIFNEIALINYKTPNKKIEKIKKIGRIFRIVNIIKKDIEDIKYDARNNIETIITVMTRKKEYDFNKYILDLLDYCLNEAEKIKLEKLTEKKFTIPINNFLISFPVHLKMISRISPAESAIVRLCDKNEVTPIVAATTLCCHFSNLKRRIIIL